MSMEDVLGQRLVAVRSRRGISQKAVARLAGVDPSYLSRIERGRVQPTVRTFMRIANGLRVSTDDLLGPLPKGRDNRPCPVSPSGQCLVELIRIHGVPAATKTNSFTPLQLRVMKNFSRLLQQRRPQVLKALDVLFSEMVIEE